MSKPTTTDSDMLPEYDFPDGVRGKYVDEYRRQTNLVAIDEDLLKAFPDSEAVNQALRAVLASSNEPK